MNSAEPQPPTTVLVDRLLDGTDQPPRRSMAIDCSGGRIDAVRAAAALGLTDDVGTLTAGSAADIVVVAGDATRNVAALQRPTMIMRAGRMIRSCR